MKRYIIKHKILFIFVLLFMLLSSIMNIGMALIFKKILDTLISKNVHLFSKLMIFFFFWEISRYFIRYISNNLLAKFIYKVTCSLKKDIFTSLLKKEIGEFKQVNSGKYISNLTSDVNSINSGYFNNIFQIADGIFSLVLGSITVAYINIYILISIILFAIINLITSMSFGKKLNNLMQIYSTSLEIFTKSLKDIFNGFEVIKSFNIEKKINNNYIKQNDNVEKLKLKTIKKEFTLKFILDLIGTLTFLVAIGIAAYLTLTGNITIGAMMASTQLMNNVVNPIMNMGSKLSKLKSIKSVSNKLDDIILNQHISHKSNKTIINTFNDEITFNNVTFRYLKEKTILNKISFKIKKGKKYAILGKSGSGKSTIIKLLLKYYKDFSGDITIDNFNIKKIDNSNLYNLISIIHQNIFIFDGTIKDNITLFKYYSAESLNKAINNSGLSVLINSLPNKENSLVGENGCNLSGGEKQRIAIARALIKNTPILVLDEATSSLDNKTSNEIENSIISIPELTCITITHNFSEKLLRKYDEILIINNGEIIQSGTFDELLNNNDYFYKLYTVNNTFINNNEDVG
ncbi:ABC transporter ATP-binding protein [Clostridium botulinum C]|uniref:ABC transporter ATP-binding protein n=1 Tax=Clostridium botulinum TaxID=1491 RepID=UPI001E5CE79B|nr:ABC transporter ATP-binding protein [Clostridium botulinum]MCD3246644.1 ABC transporter ATP-binding protein [Clostridium botulinum C]MCD3262953.1 ABC transporter ATP-binding protein [Clostridium botulinum C]